MSTLDEHRRRLQDPPIQYRPELRWWLAEGLHTDQTLRFEIEAAHRLGFGGMEFLAMDEAGVDHARYGWGAEEWVHDSEIVVTETTARGMSFSFTSGTNWSNANLPTINPDHPAAAQELNYLTEQVSPPGRSGPLPRIDLHAQRPTGMLPGERVAPQHQHLVAVLAAPVQTSKHGEVIDPSAVLDLTDQVHQDQLHWQPTDQRPWHLFVFWAHGTGQTASPSASVNYTINYLERAGVDALTQYWDSVVLTPQLREQIARNPRAQMYMDSLELSTWGAGGMFWGPTVAQEFRRRRGYDLTPWLPYLLRQAPSMAVSTTYYYEAPAQQREQATQVAKVRHDYVETLTDLYIENMLRPFAAFLHANGITLRSEISYGLPFELTRPGPEVDGIETESLEFAGQLDAYRLLAGPAHLFNKQYSSETGATSRNHMLDHRVYDQIIATQLAAGVTKTVLHGWASMAGAEGTQWPGHEGMWPMFSERFDLRQPASEFYPLWNRALGRFQYLLRQGKPRIDVAILRSDHFTDNLIGLSLFDEHGQRINDEDGMGRHWMRNRENFWWQDLGMQDAGWSYEFFDPSLLLHEQVSFAGGQVQPDGPGYQALIIYQEALNPDAAQRLLDWARQGLRLLIVNGARELKFLARGTHTTHTHAATRTPGLDGRDEELASTMAALRALPTVAEITDPARTVHALRELGVTGRAEFIGDNPNVLTYLRHEGDLTHLYAYNFLYETDQSTIAQITLSGNGAVHRIDPWTGQLSAHRGVHTDGDRTVITVELAPGQTALFTIDATGTLQICPPPTTTCLAQLESWDITVNSWDAGQVLTLTEDRGLGYTTTEALPTTAVSALRPPTTQLKAWSDMEGVGPEVSGVGEYRTTFELGLGHTPAPNGTRLVLDLGSTCGALGSVSINDCAPLGFDTSRPSVDITDLVQHGQNTLTVRVSSSLNNRLKARGYYDAIPDVVAMSIGRQSTHDVRVREHGLLGPVRVLQVR